jgi:serine protease AprX
VAHADVNPSLGYDPVANKGSLYNIAEVIGAHDLYKSGITGKGVGVALLDTGVAPVAGLTSGNVVQGPDLSFDSQDPATAYVDGYGHGTHLAGIIAGRDAAALPLVYTDPSRFTGIAPDATLVNVKVGASNGAVDVTQVIAGIDWVVQHRKEQNIRVINLSYGTDGVQDSMIDPLAFAVENAWRNGIVVVAAGGNDGETSKTLANPAADPHVLAVGAMDSAGTVGTSDDRVPSWSTHGTDDRHVDVVAPGVSVLGLRVPGGNADAANPQARVGSRFAKASGTSQAAAVVSGEAALLLQARPDLTPDQVKQLLMDTATGLPRTPVTMGGKGGTDLRKVLGIVPKTVADPAPWGAGTGSLEAARGSFHVAVEDSLLNGEVDIFGQKWDGADWAKKSNGKKAWKDGDWRGTTLTGKTWKDNGKGRKSWPTAVWTRSDPTTASDDDWSARMWRDGTWSARMWRDEGWSARMWRAEAWSSASWS